jgi:hypothetical protein
MKGAAGVAFVLGAFAGVGGMMMPKIAQHVHEKFNAGVRKNAAGGARAAELAHTEKQFEFVANAPMGTVAPLFGAWKEREWAAGWQPEFVWPATSDAKPGTDAMDREGMVFTVTHGHKHAAWVNTAFDLANGKIQYAYVVPDAMVTLITLRLTPEGDRTRVVVRYERTALDTELNAHVEQMAAADGNAGPEWEKQVNDFLQNTRH